MPSVELTADAQEFFEERAAIYEYDAKQPRSKAEIWAMNNVAQVYGDPMRAAIRRALHVERSSV